MQHKDMFTGLCVYLQLLMCVIATATVTLCFAALPRVPGDARTLLKC